VLVDKRGRPYRKEAAYLADDVKVFSKGLDPAFGWANQPLADKQRFFDRVADEWDIRGDAMEISPVWYPQYVIDSHQRPS